MRRGARDVRRWGRATVRISIRRDDWLKGTRLPAAASLLWMLYAYFASTSPNPPGGSFTSQDSLIHVDLLAHFAIYLIMAALLRWVAAALPGSGLALAAARILGPLTYTVAFGGLMELLQTGVVGRSGNWSDAITNALGAVAALVPIEAALIVRRLRA